MFCVAKGDVGRRISVFVGPECQYRAADLARKVGITPQKLNNYLSGKHDPPLDLLVSMATELGRTTDELLGLQSSGSGLALNHVASLPSKTLVRSYGYVPTPRWGGPTKEYTQVSESIDTAHCVAVHVRDDAYSPRLPDGTTLIVRLSGRKRRDVLSLVQSESLGLIVAKLRLVGKNAWRIEPPQGGESAPLGDALVLGHVIHEERTNPDGIE